jgi:type IV secretory pathway VirB4 component
MSIAASFPMVDSIMQDPAGFYIGDSTASGYPVFMDFFTRDSKNGRINSNMMVIGKSGSGKSYATKTILTNLAADRTKMFILDPEQEYDVMTRNLGGKNIDVGTNKSGILNPFHIMASLEDLDSAVADEKEIYDLFGVKFLGNEELKRLYMPENWQGHPLKKDYVDNDERLNWND